MNDLANFLYFLYGEQRGFCELCYGYTRDTNPAQIEAPRAGWFEYSPASVRNLVLELNTLVELHGNVYISSTLYTCRKRDRDHALPSRIIFLDDAPPIAIPPYSASVRTSESSRHGYYRLNVPVEWQVRLDLQKRAAAALGCDRSGADIQQLVRIPGCYNTKGGGRYAVTLETLTDKSYTVAELATQWPAIDTGVREDRGEDSVIDWAKVNYWLEHIDLLLNQHDMPYKLKPTTLSWRILAGQAQLPGDNSTSARRFVVAKGLVMHGYPDDEAAALLIYLTDWGNRKKKGIEWLQRDVERCIIRARTKCPEPRIEATRIEQRMRAKRAKDVHATPIRDTSGRPPKLTSEQLLLWYHEHVDLNNKVLKSRAEIAAELGVDKRTIARLEQELTERGLMQRVTPGPGLKGHIVLRAEDSTGDNIPLEPMPEYPHDPGQNTPSMDNSDIGICRFIMPKSASSLSLMEHTPHIDISSYHTEHAPTSIQYPVCMAPIVLAKVDGRPDRESTIYDYEAIIEDLGIRRN